MHSDRLLSPIGIAEPMSARAPSVFGAHPRVIAAPMHQDLNLWEPKLRLAKSGRVVTTAGMGGPLHEGKKGHTIQVDAHVARRRWAPGHSR